MIVATGDEAETELDYGVIDQLLRLGSGRRRHACPAGAAKKKTS